MDAKLSPLAQLLDLADTATDDEVLTAARELIAEPEPAKVDPQLVAIFGLDDDASPEQVLTAARDAQDKASKAPPTGSYQVITPEGEFVMDSGQVRELNEKAARGDEAVAELAAHTFSSAWDRAVRAGRAVPKLRQHFANLYDEAPGETLKTLEETPPLVPMAPQGSSGNTLALRADPTARDFALEGDQAELDPHDLELHRKATTYSREHPETPYPEAYVLIAEGRV